MMHWAWYLLIPIGIVAGIYAGVWVRTRTKRVAPWVAGSYSSAVSGSSSSSDSDGGGGGGGD